MRNYGNIKLFEKDDNIFQLHSIEPCHARLRIDLKPYLDALHNHSDVDKVYYQYLEPLREVNGVYLWVRFVAQAFAHHDGLDEFQKTLLFQILKENGVELIKNSMDALLFAGLENPDSPTMVEINLQIDFDEQVKVTIKDNGPGFPPNFLRHFESDAHILDYLQGQESYRKKSYRQALEESELDLFASISEDATSDEASFSSRAPTPFSLAPEERLSPLNIRSFGGRGLGLRNLTSQILTGFPLLQFRRLCAILGHEDAFAREKQEHASMVLYNHDGACVELSMSHTCMKKVFNSDYSIFCHDEDVIENVLGPIPKKFGKK